MRFLVVGCSYRTAPLALRERLAFPGDEVPSALKELALLDDVREVLLISTCNRVEVWAVVDRAEHAGRAIRELLARTRGVEKQELERALYVHVDGAAVGHIFRVTSSLDAMVVGEAQITGQVKEAYAAASRTRTVGPLLNRCLHRAFAAAKRVRSETAVARHAVSVSSVAAELAARVFGDLSRSAVLVIGAGEMAELAVRHLIADGATRVRVVNRTYDRAVELAFQLGAKAYRFDELEGQLLTADVVIASTGSKDPIITRAMVAAAMRQRKQRPMFIVDIAVPKDVAGDVGDLSNVYLFNIDDLEQVVEENLNERRREARAAQRLLEVEREHFEDWLRTQDAVPVIKELRRHFTEVARGEAERTAHALGLNGDSRRRLLDAMADAIVKKLLHGPTMELKDNASRPEGASLGRAACRLFHLEPAGGGPEEEEPAAAGEADDKSGRAGEADP